MKTLADSLGNVVESYLYDAFGNLLERASGTAGTAQSADSLTHFQNDILYAGEQYDCVTETYYLRARNYSPAEGRFLNEDRYHGDGRNLYVYVGSNPLRYTDPSGYCKKDSDKVFDGFLDSIKGLCLTAVGGTATTVAIGVAIAATGPVGIIVACVAGGVGLLCMACGVADIQEGTAEVVNGSLGTNIREDNVIRDYVLGVDDQTYESMELALANSSELLAELGATGIDFDAWAKNALEYAKQRLKFKKTSGATINSGISGNAAESSTGSTGTVWDYITSTQENYPNTKIPKSFEVEVNGEKMWVHGNATEHIYQDVYKQITTGNGTAFTNPDLYTQELMSDFYGALQETTKSGIVYGEKITTGNWEFIFSRPRQEGLYPVIKHAQFNGWH